MNNIGAGGAVTEKGRTGHNPPLEYLANPLTVLGKRVCILPGPHRLAYAPRPGARFVKYLEHDSTLNVSTNISQILRTNRLLDLAH